jgi:hypothetical protein
MSRLHDALEASLEAMRSGADLEACLGIYPDLAERLRPALEAALAASILASEEVPAEALNRSRSRVLPLAHSLRPAPRRSLLRGVPRLAFAALGAIVALLIGGRGLIVASAAALPGDPLYAVKRTAEDIRLRFTTSTSRAEIEQEYNDRRAAEILALFNLGRVTAVTFEGVVTSMGEEAWTVGGLTVFLGEATELEGNVTPGRTVEVTGETRAGGELYADRIRLRGLDFTGTVESIEGREWVIGGQRVEVPRGTPVDAGLGLGARALASIRVEDDGDWIARRIIALGPLPPPLTATPVPTPSPAPPPTQEEDNEEIEIEGALEGISGSTWLVDGRQVLVTAGTEIEGSPDPGDQVRVRGRLQPDGVILAERIRVEEGDDGGSSDGDNTATPSATTQSPGDEDEDDEHDEPVEFTGEVEAIGPGSWVIDGQSVIVTPETEIDGGLEVGDEVRVRAVRQADGSLVAERIDRDD